MADSRTLTHLPDSVANVSTSLSLAYRGKHGGKLSGGRCSRSIVHAVFTQSNSRCCPPAPECDSRRDSEISTEQEYVEGIVRGAAANEEKLASDPLDNTVSVRCKEIDDDGLFPCIPGPPSLHLREAGSCRQRCSARKSQKVRAAVEMVPANPPSLLSFSCRPSIDEFASREHREQQARKAEDGLARIQDGQHQAAPLAQQRQTVHPIHKETPRIREQSLHKARRRSRVKDLESCVYLADSGSTAAEDLGSEPMLFRDGAAHASNPVAFPAIRHPDVQKSTRATSEARLKRRENVCTRESGATAVEEGSTRETARAAAKRLGKKSRVQLTICAKRDGNSDARSAYAVASAGPSLAGIRQASRANTQVRPSLPAATMTSGQVLLASGNDMSFFSPVNLSRSSSSFMSSSSPPVPDPARQISHRRPLQPRPTVSPRTCDGRSLLHRAPAISPRTSSAGRSFLHQPAAGSHISGSSHSASSASGVSLFSSGISWNNLPKSPGNGPKSMSTNVHHRLLSVEQLPLFRKLIKEAEHAHRERRQQKLQAIRQHEQRRACVLQLLEQHSSQSSYISSAYSRYTDCGSAAKCSRSNTDWLAPSRERISQRESNKGRRWISPTCGATSGGCKATAGGGAATAASRPTFSTLRHVIRAQAASRVAREEQRRQPAHGVVPAHRRGKNLRERSNSSSRSSAASRRSRIQSSLPDPRAVIERFREKAGEDYDDGDRTPSTNNPSSAEATTGYSSSFSSKQGSFHRDMSSAISAACGGFKTSETCGEPGTFSADIDHGVHLAQRDSPRATCRRKTESDICFALSSSPSSACVRTRFRFASAEHSSFSPNSSLCRGSRADQAPGSVPEACWDPVVASDASGKRRQSRRAASAGAPEGRRMDNAAMFTVERCPTNHTCNVAMISSVAKQPFPMTSRSAEEEVKTPVALRSLTEYVKHLSSSSASSMIPHGTWGQKNWPTHMEKEGEAKSVKHQLLCSREMSVSDRCRSSTPRECRKLHDGCEQNEPFNDSLFRHLHRQQHSEPLLPLRQFRQQQQDPQAAQKRFEKYSGKLFEHERPRICPRPEEIRNDVETSQRSHVYAVNTLCFKNSRSHSDFSAQPQGCMVEAVSRVEEGGGRDTDCSPMTQKARHLPPPFETESRRARVAPVQCFFAKLPAYSRVGGKEATPSAARNHAGREVPTTLTKSRRRYNLESSLLKDEVSLHATATVTPKQEKVHASQDQDQQRRPCNETLLRSFCEQLRERFQDHPLHHNAATRKANMIPRLCSGFPDSDAASDSLRKERKKLNEIGLIRSTAKREDSRRNWLAALQDIPLPFTEDTAPHHADSPSVTRLYFPRKAEGTAARGTQRTSVAAISAVCDSLLRSSMETPKCEPSFVDSAAVSQPIAGVAHLTGAAAAAVDQGDAVKNTGLSAGPAVREDYEYPTSESISVKAAKPVLHDPDLSEVFLTSSAADAACMPGAVPSHVVPVPGFALGMGVCDDTPSAVVARPGAAPVAAAATSSVVTSCPMFATASPSVDTLPSPDSSSFSLRLSAETAETSVDVSCSSNRASNSSDHRTHADRFVQSAQPAEMRGNSRSVSPSSTFGCDPHAAKVTAPAEENAHGARGSRWRLFSPSIDETNCVNSQSNDNYFSSRRRSSNTGSATGSTDNDVYSSRATDTSNSGWGEKLMMRSNEDKSVNRRSTTTTATASTGGYVLLASHADSTSPGTTDTVEGSGTPLRMGFLPADAEFHPKHLRGSKDVHAPLKASAAAGAAAEKGTSGPRKEAATSCRLSSGKNRGYCSVSSALQEAAGLEVTYSRSEFFRGGGTCFLEKSSSSASLMGEKLCVDIKTGNPCSDDFRHLITRARECRSGLVLVARHQQAAASRNSSRGVHSELAISQEPGVGHATELQKTQSAARAPLSGPVLGAAATTTTHAGMWTAAPQEKAAAVASGAGEAASLAPHLCPPCATVFSGAGAKTAAPSAAAAIFPSSSIGGARADATSANFQQVAAYPPASSVVVATAPSAKAPPPSDGLSTLFTRRATAGARGGFTGLAQMPTTAAEPSAEPLEATLKPPGLSVGFKEGGKDIHFSDAVASAQRKTVVVAPSKAPLSSEAPHSNSSEREGVPLNRIRKGKCKEKPEEIRKGRPSSEDRSDEYTMVVQRTSDRGGVDFPKLAAVADRATGDTTNDAAAHCNDSSACNCSLCQECSPHNYSVGSGKRVGLDGLTLRDLTTGSAVPAVATDATHLPGASEGLLCRHHVDVGCELFKEQQTPAGATGTACSSVSLRTQDGLHLSSGATAGKTLSGSTLEGSAASFPRSRQSGPSTLGVPCHAAKQHVSQQRQPACQSVLRQSRRGHQRSPEPSAELKQAPPQQLQKLRQPEVQQRRVDEVYCPFVMRAALSDNLTATQMSASMFLCSNCSSRSDKSGGSGVTTAAATPSSQPRVLSGSTSSLHAGLKGRTAAAAAGSPAAPVEIGSHSECGNGLAASGEPSGRIICPVGGCAPGEAASKRGKPADRTLLNSSPIISRQTCATRCEQPRAGEEITPELMRNSAVSPVGGTGTAVLSTAATAQTAATLPANPAASRDIPHVASVLPAGGATLKMIHQQNEQTSHALMLDESDTAFPPACSVNANCKLAVSTSLASLPSLNGSCSHEESLLTQVLTHLLLLFQQQHRRCASAPSLHVDNNEEAHNQSRGIKSQAAAAGGVLNGETAACVAASSSVDSSVRGHSETQNQPNCEGAAATPMLTVGGEHLRTSTGDCVDVLRVASNSATSPDCMNGSNRSKCNPPLHSDEGNILDVPSRSGGCNPYLAGIPRGSSNVRPSSVAPGDNSTDLGAVRVRPSSPPPRPAGAVVTARAVCATRATAAAHRAAEAAADLFPSPTGAPDAAATATPFTAVTPTSTGGGLAFTSRTAITTAQTSPAAAAETPSVLLNTSEITDTCGKRVTADACATANPAPTPKAAQHVGEIANHIESSTCAPTALQLQSLGVESVCSGNSNVGSILQAFTARRPHTRLPASRRCGQAPAAASEGTYALIPGLSTKSSSIQEATAASGVGEYGAPATGGRSVVAARGELLRAGNAAVAADPTPGGRAPNGGVTKSDDFSPLRSMGGAEEEQAVAARTGACDDLRSQSETLRPLLLTSFLGMLSLSKSMLMPLIPPSMPTPANLMNCSGASRGTLYGNTNMDPRSCSNIKSTSTCGMFSVSRSKGGLCAHTSTPRSVVLSAASDAVPIGSATEWTKDVPPDLERAAALSLALLRRRPPTTALSYSASPLSLQHHRRPPAQQAQGPEAFQLQQQQQLPVQPQNQLLTTEEYSGGRSCQQRQQRPLQGVELQRCNTDGLSRSAQHPNTARDVFEIPTAQGRQYKLSMPSRAAAAALIPLSAKLSDGASLDSIHESSVTSLASSSGASTIPLALATATGSPVYASAADAPPYTLQGEGRSLSLSQLQQISRSGSLSPQRRKKQQPQPEEQQHRQVEKQDRLPSQHQAQLKERELKPSLTPDVLVQIQQLLNKTCLSSQRAPEQDNSSCVPAHKLGRPRSSEGKPCFLGHGSLLSQKPQREPLHQLDEQRQQLAEQLQQRDQGSMLQSLKSNQETRQLQPHAPAVHPDCQQCRLQRPQQGCGQQPEGKAQGDFLLYRALQQELLHHQTSLEGLHLLHVTEAAESQQTLDQENCHGRACGTGEGARGEDFARNVNKRNCSRTEICVGGSRMLVNSNREHSSKARNHPRRRKRSASRSSGSKRKSGNKRSSSRGRRGRRSGSIVHRRSDRSRFTSNDPITRWDTGAGPMESRQSGTGRCAVKGAESEQRLRLLPSVDSTGNTVSGATCSAAGSCATTGNAVASVGKFSGSVLDPHNKCVQLEDPELLKKKERKEKILKSRKSRTHSTSVKLDEGNCLNLSKERQPPAALQENFSASTTEKQPEVAVAQRRPLWVSCKFSDNDRRYSQRRLQQHMALSLQRRRPQPKRSERQAFPQKQGGASFCQRDEEQEGEHTRKENISKDGRTRSNFSVPGDVHWGSNNTPAAEQNTMHSFTEESRTEKEDRSTRVDSSTSRNLRRDSTRPRGSSNALDRRSASRNREPPDGSEHNSICVVKNRSLGYDRCRLQVHSKYSNKECSGNQRNESGHKGFRPLPKAGRSAVSTSKQSGYAGEQVLPMLRMHLQQQRELQEELEQIEKQLAGLHLLNSLTPISGSISCTSAANAQAESGGRLEAAVVSCTVEGQKRYPDSVSTDKGDANAIASRSGKNSFWSNSSGSTAYWTPLSISMAAGGENWQVARSSRARQKLSRDVKHPVAAENDTIHRCASPPHVVSGAETSHVQICSRSRISSRSAASKRSDSCERIMGKELLMLSGGNVGGLVAVKQQLREACLFPRDEACNKSIKQCTRESRGQKEGCWWNGPGAPAVSAWETLPLQRRLSGGRALGGSQRNGTPVTEKAVPGVFRARVANTRCAASPTEKHRRLASQELRDTTEQSQRFKRGGNPRRPSADGFVFLRESGGRGSVCSSTEVFADDIKHQHEHMEMKRPSGVRSNRHRVGSKSGFILKDTDDKASRNAASISQGSMVHQANRRSRRQRPPQLRRHGRNLQTSLLFDSETERAIEGS